MRRNEPARTLVEANKRIEELLIERDRCLMVIVACYEAQQVAQEYGRYTGRTGLPDGAATRGLRAVVQRFFPSMLSEAEREAGYYERPVPPLSDDDIERVKTLQPKTPDAD